MLRAPTDDQRGLKRAKRDLRLAARLRDNLRRRKAQSQARAAVSEAGEGEETAGASTSAPPGPTTDGKSA